MHNTFELVIGNDAQEQESGSSKEKTWQYTFVKSEKDNVKGCPISSLSAMGHKSPCRYKLLSYFSMIHGE